MNSYLLLNWEIFHSCYAFVMHETVALPRDSYPEPLCSTSYRAYRIHQFYFFFTFYIKKKTISRLHFGLIIHYTFKLKLIKSLHFCNNMELHKIFLVSYHNKVQLRARQWLVWMESTVTQIFKAFPTYLFKHISWHANIYEMTKTCTHKVL